MNNLDSLTITELLRFVDRSHPEVMALAKRLEQVLDIVEDAIHQGKDVVKTFEQHDVIGVTVK